MGERSPSLRHLLGELGRLDLLIRFQVWRARAHQAAGDQSLAAFCIPEAEVDSHLEAPLGTPEWAVVEVEPELVEAVQARLDQLGEDLAKRTEADLAGGASLRLVELGRRFGLSPFDLDVVLACLAPELDRRYERLYGYLHDDVTSPRLTVGLVLDLLCPDLESKVTLRGRFGAAAPLLRHHLVELGEDPGNRPASSLGATLRLPRRVVGFLLEDDQLDERLEPYVRLTGEGASLDELVFPEPFRRRLAKLLDHARTEGTDLVLYLQGAYGAGRRSVAAACARDLGLLVVHGRRLAWRDPEELSTLARLADREARLRGALLYWEDFDVLLRDGMAAHLERLLPVLEARPGPTFLAGSVAWEPVDALRGAAFVRVEFPPPGYEQRLRLWRDALAGDAASGVDSDVDLAALASTFRLTGGQIRDAATTARNLARARDPAEPRPTRADLLGACRLQAGRGLPELAQRIPPHATWDDLVLPAEQLERLREISNQVRYRGLVFDAWGFDAKLGLGKGLAVLFAGPPGTGKTMAADVLANTLGLELYKIDLAGVVSKYIGETERNLARIFDEARASNAILLFDEADALFGKRTQVRDAHDRYANVEVSYLLQKMEEHDGVVILATNLRKNMDEAFVRRLHVTVDFPLPGVAERRRIWERIWPEATPRSPGVDLDLLAERVEVAGGSIRNIALASAFLAADDGGMVTMAHLLRATRREYQKMGKVLASGELQGNANGVARGEAS